MVDRSYTNSYDLALKVVKEMPYGQWRQYDAEHTLRFFALRLREVEMLKATPYTSPRMMAATPFGPVTWDGCRQCFWSCFCCRAAARGYGGPPLFRRATSDT